MSDDRLCWLTVRDELDRRARRVGPVGWLQALLGGRRGTGAEMAGDMRRERSSSRMTAYAVPVDLAAQRLTTEERARLRGTGQVPEWFLGFVEAKAKELRKQRKPSW